MRADPSDHENERAENSCSEAWYWLQSISLCFEEHLIDKSMEIETDD